MGPAGAGPRLPPLCRVVPAPGGGRARGLPRMDSREVLHLPAVGNRWHTWYRAFGDPALMRMPAVGLLSLAAPVLHAWLGIIEPWVQVLGRSLRKLGASAPIFSLVVACTANVPPDISAVLLNTTHGGTF